MTVLSVYPSLTIFQKKMGVPKEKCPGEWRNLLVPGHAGNSMVLPFRRAIITDNREQVHP